MDSPTNFAPVSPLVPTERTGPPTHNRFLRAWATAWTRERLVRGPLYALLLGLPLLILVLPERSAGPFAAMHLALALPFLAKTLGLATDPRAEAFWGAQGGDPGVQVLARLALQAGVVKLSALLTLGAGLLVIGIPKNGFSGMAPLVLLFWAMSLVISLLLLGLAGLGRQLGGAAPLAAVGLLSVGVVGFGSIVDAGLFSPYAQWGGGLSLFESALIRLLCLVGIPFVLQVYLARRRGPRRVRGLGIALAVSSVLTLAASLPAQLMVKPLFAPPILRQLDVEAGRALYQPQTALGVLGSTRHFVFERGEFSAVGPARADALLLLDGADWVALHVLEGGTTLSVAAVGSDGTTSVQQCHFAQVLDEPVLRLRADGRAGLAYGKAGPGQGNGPVVAMVLPTSQSPTSEVRCESCTTPGCGVAGMVAQPGAEPYTSLDRFRPLAELQPWTTLEPPAYAQPLTLPWVPEAYLTAGGDHAWALGPDAILALGAGESPRLLPLTHLGGSPQ